MKGKIAISTAGHDIGSIYVVIGIENNNLLLANGVSRTMAKPKKKNYRHVMVLPKEPDGDLKERIHQGRADEAIRQTVQHYKKATNNFLYE